MINFLLQILSSEVVVTSEVRKLPPTLIEYEGRSQKPTAATCLKRLESSPHPHNLRTRARVRTHTRWIVILSFRLCLNTVWNSFSRTCCMAHQFRLPCFNRPLYSTHSPLCSSLNYVLISCFLDTNSLLRFLFPTSFAATLL
jgi:hypothetical protein